MAINDGYGFKKIMCVICNRHIANQTYSESGNTDKFDCLINCSPCGNGSALYFEFVCEDCDRKRYQNFITNPPVYGIITESIIQHNNSMHPNQANRQI